MKRYAVFAKKTEEFQPKDDFTIWWFLNDTNNREEAYHWYLTAKGQTDKYREVQIVKSIELTTEEIS